MEQYYMMQASSLLLYEVLLDSYRWWVCLFSKVSLLLCCIYGGILLCPTHGLEGVCYSGVTILVIL